MNYTILLLLPLILGAMGLVVYALIRGLYAFVDPNRINNTKDGELSESFRTQNKMMFARVKWQAIVILLIVVIGYAAT